MGWLKTGSDSKKLEQQNAAEQELLKESKGKLFRFFLKDKETAKITFVDGGLDADGHLCPPRYYEHGVKMGNGKFENIPCPEKTAPESGERCPICASGERPTLVSLFTIIDHRTVSSKDGTKTYTDTRKLLVVKPMVFDKLAYAAKKRGGLAGCTFEFARMGADSASVGDTFDFEERTSTPDLEKRYQETYKDDKGVEHTRSKFYPADYESEIIFKTGAELASLGFGSVAPAHIHAASAAANPVYVPPAQQTQYQNPSQVNYDLEDDLPF